MNNNYWPDEELVDKLIKAAANVDESVFYTRHHGNVESAKSLVEGIAGSTVVKEK